MNISAIIPTRGDVLLGSIVDNLLTYREIVEIKIVKADSPYMRYEAAMSAECGWIYTQDDDCISDVRPLLDSWGEHTLPWIDDKTTKWTQRESTIYNIMTPEHAAQYPGAITLLGFGAIFHRRLITDLVGFEVDAIFRREADRVFTALHPHVTVQAAVKQLPHATAENRMYRQPDHGAARAEIERRLREKGIKL